MGGRVARATTEVFFFSLFPFLVRPKCTLVPPAPLRNFFFRGGERQTWESEMRDLSCGKDCRLQLVFREEHEEEEEEEEQEEEEEKEKRKGKRRKRKWKNLGRKEGRKKERTTTTGKKKISSSRQVDEKKHSLEEFCYGARYSRTPF